MRVLVTGAAGFVGSEVVRQLLARGDDVIGLVRPGTPAERLPAPNQSLSRIEIDLAALDETTVERIRPDCTIHLAWFTEPDLYLRSVGENLRSLEMTIRLMRLLECSQCSRLVLAGSCLEGLGLDRSSAYVAAKRAGHLVAEQIAESTSQLSPVCAHIFYLYGPGENSRRIIPTVITKLLLGEQASVTAGDQMRDYLHVQDAASALCAVASGSQSGTVDICSGSPVPLHRIFELIGMETGRADLLGVGAHPYAPDEVFAVPGDPSAVKQTGWRPTITLEEGLAETVAWWRDRTVPARRIRAGQA